MREDDSQRSRRDELFPSARELLADDGKRDDSAVCSLTHRASRLSVASNTDHPLCRGMIR